MNYLVKAALGAGLGAVLLLAVTAPAAATTVLVTNLERMVDEAERIFVGTCLWQETGTHRGIPYTEYTFRVIDAVTGVTAGMQKVRQFGSLEPVEADGWADGLWIAGMPTYEPGGQYLLFLGQRNDSGLCAPVGLEQGVLRVEWISGRRFLSNRLANRNLTHALSSTWLERAGLTSSEVGQLLPVAAPRLEYELFLDLLQKAVAAGQKRVDNER